MRDKRQIFIQAIYQSKLTSLLGLVLFYKWDELDFITQLHGFC